MNKTLLLALFCVGLGSLCDAAYVAKPLPARPKKAGSAEAPEFLKESWEEELPREDEAGVTEYEFSVTEDLGQMFDVEETQPIEDSQDVVSDPLNALLATLSQKTLFQERRASDKPVRFTAESEAIDTKDLDAELAGLNMPLKPQSTPSSSGKKNYDVNQDDLSALHDVLAEELGCDDHELYSHTLEGTPLVSGTKTKQNAVSPRLMPVRKEVPKERPQSRPFSKKRESEVEREAIDYPPTFTVSQPQIVKTKTLTVAQTDKDRRLKKAYNMAVATGMKQDLGTTAQGDYEFKIMRFFGDECIVDLSLLQSDALLNDAQYKGLDERFMTWLLSGAYNN